MSTLELNRLSGAATSTCALTVAHLVIAGWTGRDTDALESHIRELEAIGVKRPSRTPIFYRVAASLLTTSSRIQVAGDDSSGEAEYVLFRLDDGLWVGVGSDHTDRKLEALDVTLSKQLCAKPVASDIWRYDEVAPHWDRLILRSWARVDGQRVLYQEGSVAAMRSPEELLRLCTTAMPVPSAMFCGTLAVHGVVRPAMAFEIELDDPILGRKLTHHYDIETLPIET
ncbi:MAG: DUF2848 domain-containing protein [Burkholderiales bacterium]|nr:DUF2848 domain-containing protein [Burkholderiales bacterium]